jgi:glycosyltransferase involved in cell wall biosynthesis
MEKAVVATKEATSGLAVEEDSNIVVRNSAASFAEAVIDLLRDEAKRNVIGKNARRTVLEYNSWQKKAEEIDSVIQHIG